MKQLPIIAVMLLLPGCALTDYAKDLFSGMQDTNRYEDVRDNIQSLCDDKNRQKLIDKFGKELVSKLCK